MNNYEKIGDTILIELPEEVDDYRAAGLVEETEDAFSDSRVRYVVFDFKHTNMMDSSGIGFITRRFRNVYDRDGQAFVINSNDRMERLLTMSGIFKIVTKAGNFEEAYRTVHTS